VIILPLPSTLDMPWFRFGQHGRDDDSTYEFNPPPADQGDPNTPNYSPADTSAASNFLHFGESRARHSRRDSNPNNVNMDPPSMTTTTANTSTSSTVRYPRIIWGRRTPSLTLKLRKRLYPLGITRLTTGVDVNCSNGALSFKWAWTDRLFGAKLSLERHQIALTKRLEVRELAAKFDVRAAFDMHTRKTLLSLALRPMSGSIVGMSAANNSVAIRQNIPLDKRVDVEVFGRVQMPEARFSTDAETGRFSLGEGNFVCHLDHINLRLFLQ